MALDAFQNLAISTVATAPSPAASGTSLIVAAGEGARFPTPPFPVTIWPATALPTPANAEIARCTARSTDTLTLTRAAEGPSSARTVLVGDLIAATFTKKFADDVANSSNQASGTLPDARLSANVPLLSASNVFTGVTQELGVSLRLRAVLAAPADHRLWQLTAGSDGQLYFKSLNDAGTTDEVIFPAVFSRVGNLTIFGDYYEKNRLVPQGHWAAMAYSSGNFTANSGTFSIPSGSVFAYSYTLIGKTLILSIYATGGTITGSPTELRLALPSGVTAAGYAATRVVTTDGSGQIHTAEASVAPSGSYVSLWKDGSFALAWTATVAFSIRFTFSFPIS